jgi:ABC-2 type transport system permease protein
MATTSQAPTESTFAPGGVPQGARPTSHLTLAFNAFFAILRRDIVVTGRDLIAFLAQVLLQPLFFLFIFGKVLPSIGLASSGFGALLLPGIVGLTTVLAAMQGVALPLVLDLGFGREIDDRLLAPLPDVLVALEKVVFAMLRGLVAGGIIFPLAIWILGDQYNVRSDRIGLLILLLVLAALVGACLGLFLGTSIRPEQIGLMFSLILTPLLFTGCTYYPWAGLASIKWFQIITLFNPLTYADEGIRYAMVPSVHGVQIPTLDMQWVFLGLGVSIVVFFFLGTRTFLRRVVS